MRRFAVSVLPEAEADIREAFLWYRERSPLAADGFRSEVSEAIDDLAESASVWPRDEDSVHRRVLKRFPYTIHYGLASGRPGIFTPLTTAGRATKASSTLRTFG